ncbi:hypothetical protein F4809DRAFT_634135 [Biscogniauxia mediterranea]|nr:hypothetical protein F4809DRAFT_634135 [Biscogniauxia mediterranea]
MFSDLERENSSSLSLSLSQLLPKTIHLQGVVYSSKEIGRNLPPVTTTATYFRYTLNQICSLLFVHLALLVYGCLGVVGTAFPSSASPRVAMVGLCTYTYIHVIKRDRLDR